MAGMLYLPRLFVYHADTERKSAISRQFKIMERRLLKGIVISGDDRRWITGPLLAWREGYFLSPWLHAKLALVLLLTGCTVSSPPRCAPSPRIAIAIRSRFYRFVNEAPTVIMVLVVMPGSDETISRGRRNQPLKFAEAG